MSDRRIYRLVHDTARRLAAAQCQSAPDGWIVTFQEPNRNLDQSAKFHAICNDVAKQAKWIERVLTPYQWKVLFISGHAIATGGRADMIPGLEGEFANIRESSATMSKKRFSSLIEYVLAWCAENGIIWHDYLGE